MEKIQREIVIVARDYVNTDVASTRDFTYKDYVKRGQNLKLDGTDFLRREYRGISVEIPQEGTKVKVTQSNGRVYEKDLRRGKVGFGRLTTHYYNYIRAERLGAFLIRKAINKLFPLNKW